MFVEPQFEFPHTPRMWPTDAFLAAIEPIWVVCVRARVFFLFVYVGRSNFVLQSAHVTKKQPSFCPSVFVCVCMVYASLSFHSAMVSRFVYYAFITLTYRRTCQCFALYTCHTMPINDDWYEIFASDTWYAYHHTCQSWACGRHFRMILSDFRLIWP